jgi:hypothetical protein
MRFLIIVRKQSIKHNTIKQDVLLLIVTLHLREDKSNCMFLCLQRTVENTGYSLEYWYLHLVLYIAHGCNQTETNKIPRDKKNYLFKFIHVNFYLSFCLLVWFGLMTTRRHYWSFRVGQVGLNELIQLCHLNLRMQVKYR